MQPLWFAPAFLSWFRAAASKLKVLFGNVARTAIFSWKKDACLTCARHILDISKWPWYQNRKLLGCWPMPPWVRYAAGRSPTNFYVIYLVNNVNGLNRIDWIQLRNGTWFSFCLRRGSKVRKFTSRLSDLNYGFRGSKLCAFIDRISCGHRSGFNSTKIHVIRSTTASSLMESFLIVNKIRPLHPFAFTERNIETNPVFVL